MYDGCRRTRLIASSPMCFSRGHARAACARATRPLLLAFSLLTALLVVALPQASAASSISAKRAEARQVENQIMNQQAALEKQIEKYNAVHQHYLQTRHQLQNNRIVLGVARKNLAHAQKLLAQSLTSAYKSTNEDVVSFLLASHSFTELVDHVQVLQRANDANSNLIAQQQAREQAAATAAAAAASGGSVGGTGGSIPVPPSSTLGGQAVAIAEQYLGVPYVWGGASPSGFDCSGLVMYVYGRLGVSLPHNAAAQYSMGTSVPRNALEPGDLVFFDGLGHVGIYVGGGSFIHAPHTGTVVQISSLSGWYSSEYVGARPTNPPYSGHGRPATLARRTHPQGDRGRACP